MNDGSLGSIKRARARRVDFESKIDAAVADMRTYLESLETKVEAALETQKELVAANNSSAVLLASVERWLDATHPEWDDGIRAEIEVKGEQIRRRLAIVRTLQLRGDSLTTEERGALAEELWDLARECGTQARDWPAAVAMWIQNKDCETARERFEVLRPIAATLPPDSQSARVLAAMDRRIAELSGESGRIWTPRIIP